MQTLETAQNLIIRTQIQPGDMGYITYLHGILYAKECQYNVNFEQYVAASLKEFLNNFNAEEDGIWLLEDDGKIIGSIAIMGRSGQVAQLRYFLLLPEYRGRGLGNRLMRLAMDFCKTAGYKSVYLWTAEELHTAAHLYQKFGFKRTKEVHSNHWGKDLVENCYDAIIQ